MLVANAARALSAAWGRPVLLRTPEVLRSNQHGDIVRARVVGGGEVTSVVLKHFRGDLTGGVNEWAALLFLVRRGLYFAPRFLAGNEEARLFVMEDLGPGQDLEQVLRGKDVRAVSTAMLGIVRYTVLTHVRTLYGDEDYGAIRQAIEPRHQHVRSEEASFLLEHAGRLSRWVAETGAVEDPDTRKDLEVVAKELTNPGMFLTFTHGDVSASGAYLTQAGARMLDFKRSGMRHALHDTLLWLMAVPLPSGLILRAEDLYRTGLGHVLSVAEADASYFRARMLVAASRMVNMFQWISPQALERDQDWSAGLTERSALLYHLERFRQMVPRDNPIPALTRTLASLEERLLERWSFQPIIWPAFK